MCALALPAQVYLRHKDGESIGPLPLFALEVLFDARVVDEGTPVSHNGFTFKALRDLPEILLRVQDVKEQLGRGEDPWTTPLAPPPSIAEPATPTTPATNEREPKNALSAMLRAAAKKATGQLTMAAGTDRLTLTYKDGKIASIDSNVESLSLARYLVDSGTCTEAQIAQGVERAPMMGGDIGGGADLARPRPAAHVLREVPRVGEEHAESRRDPRLRRAVLRGVRGPEPAGAPRLRSVRDS